MKMVAKVKGILYLFFFHVKEGDSKKKERNCGPNIKKDRERKKNLKKMSGIRFLYNNYNFLGPYNSSLKVHIILSLYLQN